jgi:hypothetical protein
MLACPLARCILAEAIRIPKRRGRPPGTLHRRAAPGSGRAIFPACAARTTIFRAGAPGQAGRRPRAAARRRLLLGLVTRGDSPLCVAAGTSGERRQASRPASPRQTCQAPPQPRDGPPTPRQEPNVSLRASQGEPIRGSQPITASSSRRPLRPLVIPARHAAGRCCNAATCRARLLPIVTVFVVSSTMSGPAHAIAGLPAIVARGGAPSDPSLYRCQPYPRLARTGSRKQGLRS